jgi:hypothetical protein
MCVVDDPQVSVLNKRAVSVRGEPVSFGHDWDSHRAWSVEHGRCGGREGVGFLRKFDDPIKYNREVTAKAAAGRRFARLIDFLATGRLAAEGRPCYLQATFVCDGAHKWEFGFAFLAQRRCLRPRHEYGHWKNLMGTGPSDNLIAHKAINLCEDLSGSEKRVAAAIIDHYNRKTGQCDPDLSTIARLVGVSRRTVIRAVGVLTKKGYFRKQRHGGKFHRNQYEPDWAHFRAMETRWNARRSKAIHKPEATALSPLQRQSCHIASDADVTQTLLRNSLNETFAAEAGRQPRRSNSLIADQGLSREIKSKGSYGAVDGRFHVKSTSSRNAAFDAAEGRWNNSLMKQFKAAPDVFAGLIDAIDPDLHRATTDTELASLEAAFRSY